MKLTHQCTRRREIVIGSGIMLATGLLASCTQKRDEELPKFNSVDLTGADYAKGFSLTDHNGKLRSLQDFRGKLVSIFFGFTHCPDVCPTGMAEMAEVKKLLGADGSKLQVIFISVDPQRDTPEVMKAYMSSFDPSFLALCPSPEQLAALAKEFKIYYKKVEGKTPNSYSMDHSAGTFIFDPDGRVRLFGRYGSGAQALAADMALLLKRT